MLSNSCKYGIRAVLFLASKKEDNKKYGVKEIARTLDVPQPFLSKILQELSKKDLVQSTKGPHGGFYLNEKNLDNNLMSVIEAIDGENPMSTCVLGLSSCSSKAPCSIHEQAVKSRTAFYSVFKEQSIKQIADSIQAHNLRF
ncbi:MAG: RrF2 family transcriptional regulator [Bacteroidia bacterium]